MPETITSIVQTSQALPYETTGIALSSQGHIVITECHGTRADVYSQDLVHRQSLTVTGAIQLFGIASKDDFLFLSDLGANLIHVMKDDGSYSHGITVTWSFWGGIDINNYTLYVASYSSNTIWKIDLDEAYNRAGSDQVIISSPNTLNVHYVYVNSDKIKLEIY